MLSWLQVKKRDEKRKARRKTKVYSVSHVGTKQMGKILNQPGEPVKDFRWLEKMKLAIRRSILN